MFKPCTPLSSKTTKHLCSLGNHLILHSSIQKLEPFKTQPKNPTPKPMNPTAKDHFDHLPDALVLLIFNKLHDAKSLTICLAVSKRFASLIPQTNNIFLSIPRRRSNSIPNCGLPLNFLRILANKFIAKPVQYLHRIIAPVSATNSASRDYSYYLPNQVLTNFNEIKCMHVELPSQGSEIGLDDSCSLLKWKAEFGNDLKSCIILSATSCEIGKLSSGNFRDEQECSEDFLTEDELKRRIVWTISSLIAASSRHYLLKQILKDHPLLHSVVISDASKQGKVCMGKEQLVELRNSMKSLVTLESLLERTRIPDLSMKMWYVPVLELQASGYVMRGVTLIIVRPVDGVIGKGSDGDILLAGGFDGEGEEKVLGEAVKEMMKIQKSYVMTMSSF